MDTWQVMYTSRHRNVNSLAEKKNYPENMPLYETHVDRWIKWKKKAEANEEIISFLKPPQYAKNDYIEQKTAKYVFKCLDGDIQIPEYGMFRTDFYHKDRIKVLGHQKLWFISYES